MSLPLRATKFKFGRVAHNKFSQANAGSICPELRWIGHNCHAKWELVGEPTTLARRRKLCAQVAAERPLEVARLPRRPRNRSRPIASAPKMVAQISGNELIRAANERLPSWRVGRPMSFARAHLALARGLNRVTDWTNIWTVCATEVAGLPALLRRPVRVGARVICLQRRNNGNSNDE